ncbi:MAG TPA: hypothetical protein VFH51_05995, partial [Myxococcota bacterium]|nr:hypothetical protein [Myxococcota bacterium]
VWSTMPQKRSDTAGWEKPRNRLQAALLQVEAAADAAQEGRALVELLSLTAALRRHLPAALLPRLDDLLGQMARDINDLLADRDALDPTPERRAYHLVWVRADVMQPASSHVVDGASLHSLIDDARAVEGLLAGADAAAIAALETLPPDALVAYAHMHDLALSPDTAALWRDFVAAHAVGGHDAPSGQALARLVRQVTESGMAPLWLNTELTRIFAAQRRAAPARPGRAAHIALLRLDALLRAPRVQAAIAWARDVEAWTRKWMSHPAFASDDAARIAQAWAELQAEAMTHLFAPEAVQAFATSGPLGRAAMLAMRRRGIEVCDANIKAMLAQGCPKAPLARANLLHGMLLPLLDMRDAWATTLPTLSGRTALKEQLAALREIHTGLHPATAEEARETLHIGPMFDVAGAQIGAGTKFSRHAPKTLHEVFTVVHQDLLMEGVILQQRAGLRLDIAPSPTRRLGGAILGARLWSLEGQRFVVRQPQELGCDYDGSRIVNVFHAPQRNHSARFLVQTDLGRMREVRQLRLQVELYGWQNPEQPRMNRAATYGELFARGCGLKFVQGLEPRYARDVMRFSVEVPVQALDAVEAALPEYLKLMTGILYTASINLEAPLPDSPYEFSDKATYEELCRNAQRVQPGLKPPPFADLLTRAMW